jgi:hypothetical protein
VDPVGLFDTNNDGTNRPIRNYDNGKWDVYGDAPSVQMNLSNTNPVLMTFVHDCDVGMTKSVVYYKNGTMDDTHTTGAGATASQWANPVIGAINEGYVWYAGDVVEVLIYNEAISNTNRAIVENYLRKKYGLW